MIGSEGDRTLSFFSPLLMNQLAFLLKIDFAVNLLRSTEWFPCSLGRLYQFLVQR